MSYVDALILGLVQGLTEFLPVSSSGHLVLAEKLLGLEFEGGVLLEILLHVGSALAILFVFRAEVRVLLPELPRLLQPHRFAIAWRERPRFRTVVLLLLSAVPAGVVGIALRKELLAVFDDVRLVGAFLVTTGVVLLSTRFARARGEDEVSWRTMICMALAQAVAILPGISRSGSTISAGLHAGGDRVQVGRFAFLMGLIPILGAAILEARDAGKGGTQLAPGVLATPPASVRAPTPSRRASDERAASERRASGGGERR